MTHRVVVVGAGMVGSRFVDELVRADTDGRFDIVLLGEEEYEPYNRVLLSEVVAGRVDVAALTLPSCEGDRVTVLRGTPVLAIDRFEQEVRTVRGDVFAYDTLVLATGARANIPAAGRRLSDGVHVLRSIDDCRDIVAAALNARRAVVVGGGLLGVEVACGLRLRGIQVDLVHGGPHLLDRQLGAGAGATLTAAVKDLGIGVHVGATPGELATAHGRISAVHLDDGTTLSADLVVLATGAVPEVALAAVAGLRTERGVVVGADLRTGDPHVAAIGDCAQPPEGSAGLVGQGWDQARRLAVSLTTGAPVTAPDERTAELVRLKAAGLDVVTMGRSDAVSLPGARAVTLDDPQGRRHITVVVQAGRLVAATCVGAGEVAADLTVTYDRATPVPTDPVLLLARGATSLAPEPTSPTLMPARATVCRCNGVTKGDVVHAWEAGAATVAEVAAATRAGTGCGGCRLVVQGLLDWLEDVEPDRSASPAPHNGVAPPVRQPLQPGNTQAPDPTPATPNVRA